VLVLDLNMPGEPALDAIPGLRADEPATQIVVLTMRDDLGFVREARRAGALGYVLKDAAGSELVHAIRLAAAGESYLNRHLASRLVVARTLGRNWD
jgi:two-component system response regulator NreC